MGPDPEDDEVRTKTWLDLCAHCGPCADSCFLYSVNGRDPKQVPSYKVSPPWARSSEGNVSNEFMRMCMDTAWSKCTCCNRCGSFCPYGIDMGVMFGYLRGLLNSQGFVPWELKIGSGMHRLFRARWTVTSEDFVDTCEWMVDEALEEWPCLEIPVDKEEFRGHHLHDQRPRGQHYPEDIVRAAASSSAIAGESGRCRPRAGK